MRVTAIAVTFLANAVSLISAAPVEASALLPRSVTCTNYAGRAAGSLITKRSESDLSPRATQINWCRKGSTQWISFPDPGRGVGVPAIYNTLFTQAFIQMDYRINAGQGNTQVRPEGWVTCTNNYKDCLVIEQHGHMTWARAKVATQILQNWIYVTKKYASVSATAMEYQVNQGGVRIN